MTSVCGFLFEVIEPILPFLLRSTVTVRVIRIVIPLIFLDFFMKELTEVVGEHDEGGLHTLGFKTQRPGFDLVEFVFEFIKAFFNTPAHEVELRHHAGGHCLAEGGEELHDFPCFRDSESHSADHRAALIADQLVGENPSVDRVLAVKFLWQRMVQRHVLFHPGNDIDGVVVFPDRPLSEVDDRPIPDVEDFLAFVCTLVQGPDIHSFEDAHVVGLFLGAITSEGEMGKMMGSQIEGIEMADGVFRLLAITWIMRAGGVEVSVSGVEVEVFERFVDPGLAFEEMDVFEGVLGMMIEKVFGESFEVLVSAWAFAGLEVVAFGEVHDATEHSLLDEVASRIVLSDDTLESGADPVFIGDCMTAVLVFSGQLEFKKRGDEVSEGRAARGVG